MRPILILLMAATLALATPGFDVCRVDLKQTVPLGVTWEPLYHDWQLMGARDRTQAICGGLAWAGTLTTLACVPWYEHHKWARTVCRVAACCAVGGMFGVYVAEGAIPEPSVAAGARRGRGK